MPSSSVIAKSVVVDLTHTRATKQGIINLAFNMKKVGEAVRQLNEQQIKNNRDSDGKPFVKYSEEYVTAPKKKRKRKGTGPSAREIKSRQMGGKRSPVNFVLKNQMMPDFGVLKSGRGSVEIGFNSVESKKKAAGNYRIRKFIGLHKTSKRKLFTWVRRVFFKKGV